MIRDADRSPAGREPGASYDALVIAAHPDDAEVQMGGTIALLTDAGRQVLLVDLVTGEPTEFAEAGVRARQATQAAAILGADRITLPYQDRLLRDTQELRLAVARLIRTHRPATVYATTGAAIHPDHVAACDIARAAVFLARLGQWERVPDAKILSDSAPWAVSRVFFPHCKMEPPWGKFAFAVDVSAIYERKRAALAAYGSIFAPNDRLVHLYEAEDQYIGRLLGVAYAEPFRSLSPLLVADPGVFLAGIHG
jgi:LmbE family N-acetylglucosaminyl deacetylase